MKDHIVICGLGQIGFRTYELLHRIGKQVVVITDKAPDDWKASVEASGDVVLLGDARNDALLIQARIEDASAVLAVTDQDLVNISVVMDARRLNPNIRTVCRLFDTSLGAHVSEVLGINQILSASEIAAPVFISAVLQRAAIGRSSYRGLNVSVEEIGPGQTPTGVTVIAGLDPAGRLVGGTEAQQSGTTKLGVRTIRPDTESQRAAPAWPVAVSWFFLPSLMKFRRAVLFILTVIVMSASVIKIRMGLPWIDAFYFVTTTVTTVGYGDLSFSGTSPAMKLFGIGLMLSGAAGLTLLFSTLADAFLSERFSGLFGGRNVPRRHHVIVTGAGHIGTRVVEHLTSNQIPVVVIENDRAGRFGVDVKRNVAVVQGDARNADTLRRANAGTARAILVISDDDVENVSVGLSVQKLNPDIVAVVRVFDADLSSKLQSKLALNHILSVSRIAAPYFAAAALAGEIAASVRWHDHLVLLSADATGMPSLGSVRLDGADTALHVSAIRLRPRA